MCSGQTATIIIIGIEHEIEHVVGDAVTDHVSQLHDACVGEFAVLSTDTNARSHTTLWGRPYFEYPRMLCQAVTGRPVALRRLSDSPFFRNINSVRMLKRRNIGLAAA